MITTSSTRLLRSLRLSSALASVLACAAFAPAVHAQTLPEVSVGGTGGATINRNVGAGTMSVDVNGASRIVTYDSFNLAPSTVLTFLNSGVQLPTSVLNRVVAGGPASQIDGTIKSPSNGSIAVWLVNGAGITFGPTGSFSGGSLVLSTFDLKGPQPLTDAAFLAGIAPRTVAGTSTAGILLNPGSSIISSGSVIAVGQQLAANGTITASAGDVALIAATDVQLPASLGSPLSFTINAGTTLATAQASVGGAVSGASVKLAGASQGGAIANLLNVDSGGGLTATGAGGKVVISTRARVADGIVFGAGVGGTDGISSAGTLKTSGGATDVTLLGTGSVLQGGAVTAVRDYALTSTADSASQGVGAVVTGRDFTFSATNGSAAVAGAVTAHGDYVGAARSIALGGVVPVQQTADGTVDMTASAGGITGTAGLVLTANADGTGNDALVLDATGGAIAFAAGSTLNGGLNRESTVGIRIGATPQPLTLGNVRAAALVGVDAAHTTFGTGLALAGNAAPVVLGNVDTVDALNVTANGAIGTGTIDVSGAGQGVRLETVAATRDVTTGTIDANGAVTLIATRDATVAGATTANGSISVTAGRDITGPGATGASFTANGTGRDLTLTATSGKSVLGAIKAAATVNVKANGILSVATGEATAGDLVYDLGVNTVATLGNQTAGKSIAIRTTGTGAASAQPGGATFIAGEDIAIQTGSGGVAVTRLQAGDDVDVISTGAIALASFDAQGLGVGVDARHVDFSGAGIAFVAGEQADHVGADARLTDRSGAGDLTISTSGRAAADIVLDTNGLASVGQQDAGRTIAVRGATGVTGTQFTAGEDVAAQSGGALSIQTALAGDDVTLQAAGRLDIGRANAAGSANVDSRRADFTGAAIVLQAGELAGDAGANLSAVSTGGDVVAGAGGLVRARDAALLRADAGHVRLSTLTATTGSATVSAALDVTGLVGASSGTSDTTVGRGNVSAGTGVAVTAGGLAQLGVVTGGTGVSASAGTATPTNGAIDITSATATTGALTLTARAVAPVAGTVYDGDILLGTGTAGGGATLSNVTTGGTAGTIQIADHVIALGTVSLASAGDVKIREYLAGAPGSGFVRSTAGNVSITAAKSVYGISAPSAQMVVDRGVSSVLAGGAITLNAAGDARIDVLSGASIAATLGGSLTGTAAGTTGTGVTGGALFATAPGGTITVSAGTTAADVARFNTVSAGSDIALAAGNIAVGTLTSTNGTATLNGSTTITDAGLYVGALSLPGAVSIVLGGAAAAVPVVTTTATSDLFDTGFGRANLSSVAAIAANVGRVAQLGTVQSGTGTAIAAAGIGVVGATAGTSLGLTATSGTLALTTGTAASATLVKQGGSIATAGDELRVAGSLTTTGGNATIVGDTHVRVAQADANGGDLIVTAMLGDVRGFPGANDRATLNATGVDERVVVSALAGNATLGAVTAGGGTTASALAPSQIDVRATAIDVTSATALNGKLLLNASAGEARIGTGDASVDTVIAGNAGVRIGTLTARTGSIAVTSAAGDVTGTTAAAAPLPGLAGLVTTNGVLTGAAGAADLTATIGSVSVAAFNAAQLGTVAAGDAITVAAKAVVAGSTISGFAQTLTATQGTLELGTGSAGTDATLVKQAGILTTAGDELRVTGSLTAGAVNARTGAATLTSGTHIRVPRVEARGGSVTLSAIDGEVTGIGGGRADLTAAPARDAGGVGIVDTDRSIGVTSGLGARLDTLIAGDAITVTAGSAGGAARDGAIDLIEATTTRGDLTLDVFNDDPLRADGISLARTVDAGLTRHVGGTALLRTQGSNGGSITVGDTIDAGGSIVARSVGDTAMLHAISGRTIAVMAGGSVSANDFSAVEDIGVTAASAVGIGTLAAGDDIDVTGSSLTIGSAVASGLGADTSAVDFGVSPIPIAPTERADRANASITLTATGAPGGMTVAGDLSAQRDVTVTSASSATLAANVTAGAPLGATVIGGDYRVQAANVVLGDATARTQKASGAVSITSNGDIAQDTGRLTLASNSDQTGTERLTLVAGNGVLVGNSALVGGSTTGRESEVQVLATGGSVALGKVDGQALTVRANNGIAVAEAIDAGNAARAADPVGGANTIDLATTFGGIALATGTTYGVGHDIVLTAPGPINATALTATRDLRAMSNAANVEIGTASAGRDLVLKAGGDVIAATGTATARDIAIDAGRNSRTGSLAAGGAIGVVARGGDVTGPVGASTGTSDPDFTRATMLAGSTLDVVATGLVQLGTGQAASGLRLTAGDATHNGAIDATSVTTIMGDLLLDARAVNGADSAGDGDILLGSAQAGGNLTMTNVARGGTLGNIAVASAADAGGSLLIDSAGNATLPLGTAGGAGTVRAVGDATANSLVTAGTATLRAGRAARSAMLIRSTGANVVAEGASVVLNTADAKTALVATARNGDLTLDTGIAGSTAALTTLGADAVPGSGDLSVATSLTSGQGATIAAFGDARLTSVTAITGDVKVIAPNGETTGVGAGAADLKATAGAVHVDTDALARLGTVVAGTTLAVTGTGVVRLATGRAGTGLTATAGTATSNGAIDATSVDTTSGDLLLDARATSIADPARNGHIAVGTAQAGGNLTLTNVARGGSAGDIAVTTGAAAGGALLLDSAGKAALQAGTANGVATVRALGNASADSLTAGGTLTLSANGSASSATLLKSTASNVVVTAASVSLNTANAKTALDVTARSGDLVLATGLAGSTADLTTSPGGTGNVIVGTALTTGQAAAISSASDARLAAVTAATGALKVTALAGEVTGIGAAAAILEATAGSVQVDAGTLARLGTVKASTTLAVTGDTVTTGALTSGTTMSLIADAGALAIAGATSGGDVTLATTSTATLGAIAATGRKLTLTAPDAAINGAIAAQRIEVHDTSASNTLRLGDDLAAGTGFDLSQAEINNLNAAEILLDAGTATGSTAQNIAIGKLALDADTGSSKLDILGLKRIDVTGAFTAPGSATTRTIRFGGSAVDTTRASIIRVRATATAGGRIDIGDAALDLRGDKIGVGQDDGFLALVGLTPSGTPITASDVASRFVGNANSSLYNAGIGGVPYTPQGAALVTARSLTARFSDYLLIQNTSSAGRNTGVVLGGTLASPVEPALRVIGPNPPDAGAVALFGSINGTVNTGTALLGPSVVEIVAVDRGNARINGCVIGAAGGGCIAGLISQPVLGVFDSSKVNVFKTATDFEIPFDPVIGTNNESLFGDVGTFGLGDIPLEAAKPSPPCPPDDQPCLQAKKDSK